LEFYAHPTEWETKYSRATSDGLFVTNNAHPTAMLKRIFDACHYKKKEVFFSRCYFLFSELRFKIKKTSLEIFPSKKKEGERIY
jgi:hypothetical protein